MAHPSDDRPNGGNAGGQGTGAEGGRSRPKAHRGPHPGGEFQNGPSVGDIFDRAETVHEMKLGIAVFGVIGTGLGLGVFLTGVVAANAITTDPGYVIAVFTLLSVFALGPVVACVVALRQARELPQTPDKLRLATAAVTGAGGSFLMTFVAFLIGVLGLDTTGTQFAVGFGGAFLPMVLGAVGAGLTAAGVVYVLDRLET